MSPSLSAVSPELPTPDPDAIAHSRRLEAVIRHHIAQSGGRIPFSRFMELALYAPGLGYYVAGRHKFGDAGDFVTAPELGDLFARCLAVQCADVLAALGHGDFLEFGAGSGIMAADVLLEMERLDALPGRYFIVELSPDLRERQRHTIAGKAAHLIDRVVWLERLPEAGFRGVVVANEVVDAMPVTRFQVHETGIDVLSVGHRDGGFYETPVPADPGLRAELAALGLPPGYRSEINTLVRPWLRSVSDAVAAGVLLIVDYGFPRREYYHPQRSEGTLMCHYRHRAHGNPYMLVGLQDITAHVDFTAVADGALAAGWSVLGYAALAPFLLSLGLLDRVPPAPASARDTMLFNRQVKTLTLPTEMGELFKVIAFGRDVPVALRGFALADHRDRL